MSFQKKFLYFLCVSLPLVIIAPALIYGDAFFFMQLGDDDSFYYFVIAKNIINGYGSSFDGISQTNGYHPLWMISIIPIFALEQSDLFFSLRSIYLFSSILLLSGIFLIFKTLEHLRIDRVVSLFTIIIFVLFPMPFTLLPISIFDFLTGIETPLLFFLLAALFLKTFNFDISKNSDYFLLGLLIALLILTRVDSILYLLAFPYIVFINKDRSVINPFNMFLFFAPVLFLATPYFIYNYFIFGHFEPVSGMTKSFYGSLDNGIFSSITYRFIQTFLTVIPLNHYLYDLDLALIIKKAFLDLSYQHNFFARVIVFLVLSKLIILSVKYFNYNVKSFSKYKWIAFFAFFHILFYVIVRNLVETGFHYWVFEHQCLIILFAFIFNKYRRKIKYLKLASVSFLSFSLLFFLSDFLDRSIDLTDGEYEPIIIEQLISEYIEDDAIIAMPNSGQNSYYTNRVIVNLDGFVNSYDYLYAFKKGDAVNHLKDMGVGYILLPANYLNYEPYKSNFSESNNISKIKLFEEEKEILFELN